MEQQYFAGRVMSCWKQLLLRDGIVVTGPLTEWDGQEITSRWRGYRATAQAFRLLMVVRRNSI
jgi:hypothetical protein